jgi:hypothetical protein
MMITFWRSLPIILLAVLPVSVEVRCRYNSIAPDKVTYYTCTELATKYGISVQQLFLLNPLLDPDCTSIQAGEPYCVAPVQFRGERTELVSHIYTYLVWVTLAGNAATSRYGSVAIRSK